MDWSVCFFAGSNDGRLFNDDLLWNVFIYRDCISDQTMHEIILEFVLQKSEINIEWSLLQVSNTIHTKPDCLSRTNNFYIRWFNLNPGRYISGYIRLASSLIIIPSP